MKANNLLGLVVACSLCIVLSSFALASDLKLGDSVPKTWVVNLDAPPAQRWPWAKMVPYYNQSVQDALNMISQFVPGWFQEPLEFMAEQLLPFLGDYAGEITSAANVLGIPLGKAVLLNIIYEVEAGCTSIVAQDTKGNIVHGRNLDFNLASVLRRLTIEVDFQRGGKTLYKGTTYVGYVGLLTGMRPGAFSISADERDTGYIAENLLEALFVPGTTAACFLIRDTLQDIDDFEVAIGQLATTSLAAPIYLIVGGTKAGQGAVITRDRDGAADIWRLDAPSRWFEVETNYDHWLPAEDDRRKIANEGMAKLGQAKVSLDGLYQVLSTYDVLNNGTTYTTLMSPATGNFTTYIRNL